MDGCGTGGHLSFKYTFGFILILYLRLSPMFGAVAATRVAAIEQWQQQLHMMASGHDRAPSVVVGSVAALSTQT